MRFLLPAIAALGLLATSASAQGSGFNPFNGPYLGVQGGYQLDRAGIDAVDDGGSASGRQSVSGLLYGGQIGIDQRIAPHIVFGVEGSITGDTGSANIPVGDGTNIHASVGRTFNVTGRVGYLVNPTGLFYGRAGWTNSELTVSVPGDAGSATRSGYLLGVGYEQSLSRHLSARLEYDYSRFADNLNLDLGDYGPTTAHLFDNRHAVTLGVNYRF